MDPLFRSFGDRRRRNASRSSAIWKRPPRGSVLRRRGSGIAVTDPSAPASPGPQHLALPPARAHRAAAHRCGRPRPAGEPGRLRCGGGPPAPQGRGAGPRGRERPRRALDRRSGPHRGPRGGRRPGRPPPPPARGRVHGLPAGITRAAGAGWERPPAREEEWDKHSPSGAVFRQERAGRSQPRSPPQKAESGFRGRPPKRDGDNRFRFRVSAIGTHLSTQLRGV